MKGDPNQPQGGSRPTDEARILPEMVPLHRVAKELGKATHVLVSASREGQFPPVVRVGALWFVKAQLLREWFDRQHAVRTVTPAQEERIRQAGRTAVNAYGYPLPNRRRRGAGGQP